MKYGTKRYWFRNKKLTSGPNSLSCRSAALSASSTPQPPGRAGQKCTWTPSGAAEPSRCSTQQSQSLKQPPCPVMLSFPGSSGCLLVGQTIERLREIAAFSVYWKYVAAAGSGMWMTALGSNLLDQSTQARTIIFVGFCRLFLQICQDLVALIVVVSTPGVVCTYFC